MSYEFKATKIYWKHFYALSAGQKASTRKAWGVFQQNPFDARLGTHEIKCLSGRARETIYSVWIEENLRCIFCIRGNVVVTLDIGSHDVYK